MKNSFAKPRPAPIIHGSFRGSFRPRRAMRLVPQLTRQLRDWQARKESIKILNAMPDRLLLDIGIERYEIAQLANRSKRVEPCVPLVLPNNAAFPIEFSTETRQAA